MAYSLEIKVPTPIPFLKPKTVLLIEDPTTPIPIPHPYYWEEVKEQFRRFGYTFIFIPELLSGITPMMADYLFPGYDAPSVNDTYRLIRHLTGVGTRCGLLYKQGRSALFKDLSGPGTNLQEAIGELLDAFMEEAQSKVRKAKVRRPVFGIEITPRRLELPSLDYSMEEVSPNIQRDKSRFSFAGKEDEELDEKTLFILADIERVLKGYQMTLEDLRFILGYKVKLSHLEITRSGRIFLRDFPDKATGLPKEVKMDALTKMLYFFFLKHPEGVRVKEVDNHIDELMHIYMGITGRDDKDAIRASIQGHVDPFGNSINVSMSRIKGAFKNQVDESVARFYWVEGNSGEPYRIAIDRDYVIWEY